MFSAYFSFPFVLGFFFFNQSLHAAPVSFCVHIGLDDVPSVLGQVSGICLVLGFSVAQSTAQTCVFAVDATQSMASELFFMVLEGFVLTCVRIKRAGEFSPRGFDAV